MIFWLRINQPAFAEPLDAQTEHLFESGHRVEQYARQLFAGGIMVGNGSYKPVQELLVATKQAMESDAPYVYEGAFSVGPIRCRSDILHHGQRGSWNLAEVKMSAHKKDEHILDLGFQCRCIQESGYDLGKIYLVRINGEYIRLGEIEPSKLFVSEELTSEVWDELSHIPAKVQVLLEIAAQAIPPNVIIGSHCKAPGMCPFYRYCHDPIPSGSVFEIPYGGKIIPQLLARGIIRLVNVPDNIFVNSRQANLVKSAKEGKPIINKVAIRGFINQLEYPLYYLDFETINPVIPPFNHSSPYVKIPFQFSVHVQRTENGSLEHFEYLPTDASDPRPPIISELLSCLGNSGSIVGYNVSFEKSVIHSLAEFDLHSSVRLKKLIDRCVDLIIPLRSGAYSDFRFGGSASLKRVLPVLVPELSYVNLAIQKGDDASLLYQKFIDGNLSRDDWLVNRSSLLAYCNLDTMAMVRILDFLRGI